MALLPISLTYGTHEFFSAINLESRVYDVQFKHLKQPQGEVEKEVKLK